MVHDPAGFWVRLISNLLDGVFMFVFLWMLSVIFNSNFNLVDYSWFDLVSMLYYLLLPIFWTGYTVGKRAFGVRIVRMDGGNVTLGNMLLRQFVAGLIYLFTLGIAMIVSAFMIGLREDKRSIHDFVAGTYVTYEKPGEGNEIY